MRTLDHLTAALLVSFILGILAIPSFTHAQQEAKSRSTFKRLKLQLVGEVPLPGGISRFDYQTIDVIKRKLFISHMGANSMIVYDLNSNRVVGTVTDIPRPTGILAVPELDRVYVSASAAKEVYVIDETTLKKLGTVRTGSFPDGIAYDPELKRAFVSCEFGSVVTAFDAQSDKVITNISMGGHVGNTHFDPLSRMIFSTVQTLGELVEINPRSLKIVARYHLEGCEGPHGFCIVDKPHFAFITGEDNASYVVFDLSTKSIISRGKVGIGPDVLAYDSSCHRLYVGSESGMVSAFDMEDMTVRDIGNQFLAEHAHSVSIDTKTHRAFFPLQDVGGKAVLWIMKEH